MGGVDPSRHHVRPKKWRNVSRERRMRQLTEKGSQYQMNLQLDKRNKSKARLRRKSKPIDYLLYSSSRHSW